ncbi:MAG: hypothetical protein KatS3mg031_0877 [Chitinophagales bacterium]|nr:MAG: hypothetical protein KatS3mg031_0877 [Chitinophagales bacterium]
MDYRKALIEFYEKHNPAKLPEVDLLLKKYKGREAELLHALKIKYGVKDTAPGSTSTSATAPNRPETPPAPSPKVTQQPAAKANEPQSTTIQEPQKTTTTETKQTMQNDLGKKEPEKKESVSSTQGQKQETGKPDLRGKTAAERAEYWKKELERRQQERQKQATPTNSGKKSTPTTPSSGADAGGGKKSGVSGWIKWAVVLIVLLVAGVGATLWFNKDLRTAVSQKLGLSSDTPGSEKTKKEAIDPSLITQEETSTEDNNSPQEENTEEGTRVPTVEDLEEPPAPTDQTTQKPASSTPVDASDGGTPVRGKWYVSYYTLSSKEAAAQAVNELKAQGISNCGYYYMPDYTPGAKPLYKVYVGPFSTLEEAEETRLGFASEKPDAYPYRLR